MHPARLSCAPDPLRTSSAHLLICRRLKTATHRWSLRLRLRNLDSDSEASPRRPAAAVVDRTTSAASPARLLPRRTTRVLRRVSTVPVSISISIYLICASVPVDHCAQWIKGRLKKTTSKRIKLFNYRRLKMSVVLRYVKRSCKIVESSPKRTGSVRGSC